MAEQIGVSDDLVGGKFCVGCLGRVGEGNLEGEADEGVGEGEEEVGCYGGGVAEGDEVGEPERWVGFVGRGVGVEEVGVDGHEEGEGEEGDDDQVDEADTDGWDGDGGVEWSDVVDREGDAGGESLRGGAVCCGREICVG